jgi:molecular chaperone GrpE
MSLDTSDSKRSVSAAGEQEAVTGGEDEMLEVSEDQGGEAVAEEDLESRIADLEGEVEQLRDQLLRRQAELINFRKRAERERAELGAVAQASVLEKLLPVIDDFERALVTGTEDTQAYRQGVELILKSMENVLTGMGVQRLEPLGEDFDPEFHEAIARVETEEHSEGQVVDVFLPGYRVRDRLLRPARVAVAARPQVNAGEADSDSGESSEFNG